MSLNIAVGGGGLLAATAAAVKQINSRIKVIGVEPEWENDTCQSFHGKDRVVLNAASSSIADAVRVLTPSRLTLPLIRYYDDDIVTVTEAEIAQATLDATATLISYSSQPEF